MSDSFWKFSNGFASISNISSVLESHTSNDESGELVYSEPREALFKLLDESDLLQELLSNSTILLKFLRQDSVLSILVDLVVNEGVMPDELSGNMSKLSVDTKQEGNRGDSAATESSNEEDGDHNDNDDDDKDDDVDALYEKGRSSSDINSNDSKSNDTGALTTNKAHKVEKSGKQDSEAKKGLTKEKEERGLNEDSESENYDETEEEKANRYAALAAEVLSADVWSLTDTVMESTESLNKLWSVLDSKESLSINLSTYFMKIMEHLLDMKCDEMITYLIENQPKLVEKFINHLSNPPLMDFLLKLISTDKPDNSTGIIDFLQNQDFITHLINALDVPNQDLNTEEYHISLVRQSSAADFLKALITISANSTTDNSTIGPNELTRELVSYPQISRLCEIMLKGGYALANGVGIIIEIIRKNNCDYDILPVLYITVESHPPTGRDPIYLGHLLKVFGSNIDKFNELLMKQKEDQSSTKPNLKTSFGEIEPLGFERFKICELVAELLHCSNMALLNDNNGFDIVQERDAVRRKMKEFDPISFKYNEVIVLPTDESSNSQDNQIKDQGDNIETDERFEFKKADDENYANDTIDSFNSKFQQDEGSVIQNQGSEQDEEEPHANTNLTEEQIRAKPVIGDFLKIALRDTQIITNILSMFFSFSWNNFLHNVVFDIVQQVLNGSMDIGFNKFLAIDLFESGDITNKIIDGQKYCSEYGEAHNGLRLGFMGHLTLIAEEVVKFIQLYPTNSLSELIDKKVENEVWEEYVNNVLFDTREKYNAILGGGEEEDEDDASNTFDEGTGELMGQNGYMPELATDPSIDHDILNSGYEGNVEQRDLHGEPNTANVDISSPLRSNSSDESSEEDDDHFTNYMSQQLTNTASTEIVSSISRSNKDDTEKEASAEIHSNSRIGMTEDNDDDDEYIDPNDDGLSYKKPSSVYDGKNSFLKIPINEDEPLSSEESSSSSSDSEDEVMDDDRIKDNETDQNELRRAASKS